MNYPKRKRRVPWHPNPNVTERAAKLARLKRKGLLPPPNKATARAECAAAANTCEIKRLPIRRRASVIIDKLTSSK